MGTEEELAEVKKKYLFESKFSDNTRAEAELAFLAALDRLFTEAKITLNKPKLRIMDVGCGTMPYAWPLKVFFERFGCKGTRKVSIVGVDFDTSTPRRLVKIMGIDGITFEDKPLEEVKKGGFDIITCFNTNTASGGDIAMALSGVSIEKRIDARTESLFRKVRTLLDNKGFFLLSFDFGASEFAQYGPILKKSGFDIVHKEKNKFVEYLALFSYMHRCMCIAKK